MSRREFTLVAQARITTSARAHGNVNARFVSPLTHTLRRDGNKKTQSTTSSSRRAAFVCKLKQCQHVEFNTSV